MQFQDDVAGGVVLIRPALQSPDYVPGTSGWQVSITGAAEFNNITIRGGGTSDPVVVGNADSPQVVIRTSAGNGLIIFPTNRPVEQDAATVGSAVVDPGTAAERAELQIVGPTVNGAPLGVRLVLGSRPQDASDVARFSVQNRAGTDVYLTADGDQVLVTGRPLTAERADAAEVAARTHIMGEAFPRLTVTADGGVQWGPGTAGPDTNLYRAAEGILQTDDTFVVLGEFSPRNLVRGERPNPTDSMFESRAVGDTRARWFTYANGQMWWGPGSAVQDTNLYRQSAGVLHTDGALSVGTTLAVAATDFTVFTPVVSGTGGATWTTRTGWYHRLGDMVYVCVHLVVNGAGSGATLVSVDMPTDVYRGTRQTLTMHTESTGPNGSHIGNGNAVFFAGAASASTDRLRTSSNDGTNRDANLVGADLLAGGTITIEGWYREP